MSERGFVRDYRDLVISSAREVVVNSGIKPPLRLDFHIAH
jgi:hypothetical protein